jgi:hypothetical protein
VHDDRERHERDPDEALLDDDHDGLPHVVRQRHDPHLRRDNQDLQRREQVGPRQDTIQYARPAKDNLGTV